jgi:hypothetical protein
MLSASSLVLNFHNHYYPPKSLTSTKLKAELIKRTSTCSIYLRFAELA